MVMVLHSVKDGGQQQLKELQQRTGVLFQFSTKYLVYAVFDQRVALDCLFMLYILIVRSFKIEFSRFTLKKRVRRFVKPVFMKFWCLNVPLAIRLILEKFLKIFRSLLYIANIAFHCHIWWYANL